MQPLSSEHADIAHSTLYTTKCSLNTNTKCKYKYKYIYKMQPLSSQHAYITHSKLYTARCTPRYALHIAQCAVHCAVLLQAVLHYGDCCMLHWCGDCCRSVALWFEDCCKGGGRKTNACSWWRLDAALCCTELTSYLLALHSFALSWCNLIALPCVALRRPAICLHCSDLNCTALQCTTLYCTAGDLLRWCNCIAVHRFALPWIALSCIALNCSTLVCNACQRFAPACTVHCTFKRLITHALPWTLMRKSSCIMRQMHQNVVEDADYKRMRHNEEGGKLHLRRHQNDESQRARNTNDDCACINICINWSLQLKIPCMRCPGVCGSARSPHQTYIRWTAPNRALRPSISAQRNATLYFYPPNTIFNGTFLVFLPNK